MMSSTAIGLNIWKPNQRNTGGALMFRYSPERQTLFLEARPQTAEGDTKFDKENSITVKLNVFEVGELLSVLRGQKNEAGPAGGKGLYHETDTVQTSIKLSAGEKGGWYMSLSTNNGRKAGAPIWENEGVVLQEFFRAVMMRFFEDNENRIQSQDGSTNQRAAAVPSSTPRRGPGRPKASSAPAVASGKTNTVKPPQTPDSVEGWEGTPNSGENADLPF